MKEKTEAQKAYYCAMREITSLNYKLTAFTMEAWNDHANWGDVGTALEILNALREVVDIVDDYAKTYRKT